MKIKVDQELCIGCGACQAICPSVFEFNDEGLAQAKEDVDFEALNQSVKEEAIDALEGCPTSAISKDDE